MRTEVTGYLDAWILFEVLALGLDQFQVEFRGTNDVYNKDI
jgi:hypothetical protein